MTEQPENLEERAGKATEESAAAGAPEGQDKPHEAKAAEIADDVRAETGEMHEDET